VELLTQLSWLDLVIIGLLAVGVFVGFTQGFIRYVLNAVAVLVAFVLASQLTGPIIDLLSFWRAFSPEGRELIVFVLLFIGLTIGGWFAIRALYRRTRLPVARQIDELGGAVLGFVWVAFLLVFHLVVLDSFFLGGGEAGGWLRGYYEAMNDSLLVGVARDTIIPTAGLVVRPFVPAEIARLLEP
jgi:hypothetical protein